MATSPRAMRPTSNIAKYVSSAIPSIEIVRRLPPDRGSFANGNCGPLGRETPLVLQRHLKRKRRRLDNVEPKNGNRLGAAAWAGAHRNRGRPRGMRFWKCAILRPEDRGASGFRFGHIRTIAQRLDNFGRYRHRILQKVPKKRTVVSCRANPVGCDRLVGSGSRLGRPRSRWKKRASSSGDGGAA